MTEPARTATATHLVLIPSYNPGPALRRTVRDARERWPVVWVVSDGSHDGSEAGVEALGARLFRRPRNGGKGAAVLTGIDRAAAEGFTHALVMDADGQHPAEEIPRFMAASLARPGAMVLGQPRFGAEAPWVRVAGRRLANGATRLAARGVGDALFGFRVYPVGPLRRAMRATRWMRGFDFDPEAAIRLARMGVPAVRLDAAVRYFAAGSGGVSHYRYVRDNLLLAWMFLRLATGAGRPGGSAEDP